MPGAAWPQPPIWWEDLPDVLELLGSEADDKFRCWVLVPVGWLEGASLERGMGGQRKSVRSCTP